MPCCVRSGVRRRRPLDCGCRVVVLAGSADLCRAITCVRTKFGCLGAGTHLRRRSSVSSDVVCVVCGPVVWRRATNGQPRRKLIYYYTPHRACRRCRLSVSRTAEHAAEVGGAGHGWPPPPATARGTHHAHATRRAAHEPRRYKICKSAQDRYARGPRKDALFMALFHWQLALQSLSCLVALTRLTQVSATRQVELFKAKGLARLCSHSPHSRALNFHTTPDASRHSKEDSTHRATYARHAQRMSTLLRSSPPSTCASPRPVLAWRLLWRSTTRKSTNGSRSGARPLRLALERLASRSRLQQVTWPSRGRPRDRHVTGGSAS